MCSADVPIQESAIESESETDIEADADASGGYEAASRLQGSFPEADTNPKCEAATDPFQNEDPLATDSSLEKRARKQEQMFDAHEQFLDDEDIEFDAYG